jgi:MoaA/NifB/PqqE/SkfB family radical SAM enzyme
MVDVPPGIQIEVSTICNARCVMCDSYRIKRPHAIIDESLFKRIVDEWATLKTNTLSLSWMGEPLFDPKLADKIRYAKALKKRSHVFVYSNASLLNDSVSKDLIESGLDKIYFSVDGYTKETFEAVRQGLDFDTVVANITNFMALRNRLGKTKPFVTIRSVDTKLNTHELNQLKKFWAPRADGGLINSGLHSHLNHGSTKSKGLTYKNRQPCPFPFINMPICVTGKVGVCCQHGNDDIIAGDVTKQSIQEIWSGELFRKYRRYHLERRFGELPACDICPFWKYMREDMPWFSSVRV